MKKPRLDQYLYHTSFFSSRTEAQEFISSGFVLLNGDTAKQSSAVKNGDIIKIINQNYFIKIQTEITIEGNTCYVGYKVLEKGKINIATC